MPRKIVQSIKALWADTNGVILPYVTVMLVVIIGVSVLALDGAQFMYLQTQLPEWSRCIGVRGCGRATCSPRKRFQLVCQGHQQVEAYFEDINVEVVMIKIKFLSSSLVL